MGAQVMEKHFFLHNGNVRACIAQNGWQLRFVATRAHRDPEKAPSQGNQEQAPQKEARDITMWKQSGPTRPESEGDSHIVQHRGSRGECALAGVVCE